MAVMEHPDEQGEPGGRLSPVQFRPGRILQGKLALLARTWDVSVNEAAKRMNLTISPDPAPEEVIFIRSDQYSFVKQGVPSVFPVAGFKSDDPKINPEAIFKNWEQTRYHQPSDDMEQPGLNFDEAAKYARFVFLCAYLITEDTASSHGTRYSSLSDGTRKIEP